jgi:FKBP-type peptidyl-prolyl cis-trans isomerase
MIYRLLAFLCLAVPVTAQSGMTITQTDGPTECDEKTASGHYLSMHYTGTIDESSKTGTPGKQFDSSIPRGKTFDFRFNLV